MNTHDMAWFAAGIVTGWWSIIIGLRLTWWLAKRHVARDRPDHMGGR